MMSIRRLYWLARSVQTQIEKPGVGRPLLGPAKIAMSPKSDPLHHPFQLLGRCWIFALHFLSTMLDYSKLSICLVTVL